jgi:hypothetical protein
LRAREVATRSGLHYCWVRKARKHVSGRGQTELKGYFALESGICKPFIPTISSANIVEARVAAFEVRVEKIDLKGGKAVIGHTLAEVEEIREELVLVDRTQVGEKDMPMNEMHGCT